MSLFSRLSASVKSNWIQGSRNRRVRLAQLQLAEPLEHRCLLAASTFTPEEQFMLELMNRARANPAAEASRLGVGLNDSVPAADTISAAAKQPLAPNNILRIAATGHTADMFNRDFFAHDSPAPSSTTAGQRITSAGYIWSTFAENLSLRGGTVVNQTMIQGMHDGLFRSASHRINMMNNTRFETGVGVDTGRFTDNGPILGGAAGQTYDVGLATIKFGAQADRPYLTGVVYTDASNGSGSDNAFFDVGEQTGNGATVTARNTSTGASFTEVIGAGGGYSIQVPAGTYNVSITGGGLSATYYDSGVVVGTQNEKVDFETTTASTTPPAGGGGGLGDVDGSSLFDANDSFLIQLVLLAGTNTQIDQSKGASSLSASEIRTAVGALQTQGDVDGDGSFDANDAFLMHLVMLSGTNSQIDQSKGASPLSAAEIRSRIEGMGAGGTPATARFTASSGRTVSTSLFKTTTQVDSPQVAEIVDRDSEPVDQLWTSSRSWLDVL